MTRKDFQLIADVVNDAITRENGNTTKIAEHRREAARDMAYSFGVALSHTNDRFDASRFYAACFVGTEFER